MLLKTARFTVEYEDGNEEELNSVDELQEQIEQLDNEYGADVTYTLVYECLENNHNYADSTHEYPTDVPNWEAMGTYAIESADPCQICRDDYALINDVGLGRISVNCADSTIETISVTF